MNTVSLLGRITKDPELSTYNGDKQVCKFTLAVNRYGNTADFIPCVAWGKNAVNIEKFCKKGTQIGVQGNLKTGSFTGKDGKKVYTWDVWVDKFFFTAKPSLDGAKEENAEDGFTNIADGLDDEGLPFN